ncbi:MAG: hypothetical protein F6J93_02695 [Oscillatoria sp. SIO1A7]|nr:hypothetical protein [Oscillatoria sp. SIO1A7]
MKIPHANITSDTPPKRGTLSPPDRRLRALLSFPEVTERDRLWGLQEDCSYKPLNIGIIGKSNGKKIARNGKPLGEVCSERISFAWIRFPKSKIQNPKSKINYDSMP